MPAEQPTLFPEPMPEPTDTRAIAATGREAPYAAQQQRDEAIIASRGADLRAEQVGEQMPPNPVLLDIAAAAKAGRRLVEMPGKDRRRINYSPLPTPTEVQRGMTPTQVDEQAAVNRAGAEAGRKILSNSKKFK